MKKPYLVGITGGSGSGKTYFLSRLMKSLNPNDVCLISQDNYYRPREEQPIDENGVSNFDTPQSIDHQQFSKDIAALCEGKTVYKEEYTFNNPNIVPKQLVFEPKPIIIVEGLFVFYHQDISDLLNLKLFVEATDPVKIKRRIMRDNKERGYDLEDVLYRYVMHVSPAYERYVRPYKENTDIIVPNNHTCDIALEVVINHLKKKLYTPSNTKSTIKTKSLEK
ncbi:uridine kinase [Bernardetia sp. OM2101]|uniref:uridine kinase n=1 Tax=Bernardetia sp. OM2101 TaxID=3344876 RepID=UPI0035CFFCB5